MKVYFHSNILTSYMQVIKRLLFVVVLLISIEKVYAQPTQLFFVVFTDKASQTFEPEVYFSTDARNRRIREGIPTYDYEDLPVNPIYIDAIRPNTDSLRHVLRWLNAVSISASRSQIERISRFPFVKEVTPFGSEAILSEIEGNQDAKLDTLLSLSWDLLEFDSLKSHNLNGRGVNIAILDAGFKHANTHPALQDVFVNKQIIATKNFYSGGTQVYEHASHGTSVLCNIAGRYNDRALGCAPKAKFLLARIEHVRKEKASEEDNWIAAAEWADRMGADIISSSITYHYPRYTPAQMDGTSSFVSKAAAIASRKGMLVVSSMGNEGDRKWKFMGAPSDVPEVLSVGGSMPMMPMYIKFASIGPNALGQQKPDIAAPAYVVSSHKKNKFDIKAGTSYATPLIAGLAACIWQLRPSFSREEVANTIKKIGHFYPYFDYWLGNGIPKAGSLFNKDSSIDSLSKPFFIRHTSDTVFVEFNPQFPVDSLQYSNGRVIHYHLANEMGNLMIQHYDLIPLKQKSYFILKNKDRKGTFRLWFDGYLHEEQLPILE